VIFWAIYASSSLLISYLISLLVIEKIRLEAILILIIFFLTPSLVEMSSSKLSPAIAVFFFDLVLENTFSTRSLRPLFISLPLGFTMVSLVFYLRRKYG